MDEKSSKPRKPSDAEAGSPDKPAPKPRPEKPADGRSRIELLEGLMQRREVRIGMAVLAVLVLVLGYVFVSKINEGNGSQANNPDDEAFPTEEETHGPLAERPPTVVKASAVNDSIPAAPPTEAPSGDEPTYATDGPRHEHGPPTSYLPRRAPVEHVADAPRTGDGDIPHADAPPDAAANDTTQRYGDHLQSQANAATQGKYGHEPHALSPMDVEAPVESSVAASDDAGVAANTQGATEAVVGATAGNPVEHDRDHGGERRYGDDSAVAQSSDVAVAEPRAIETHGASAAPNSTVANSTASNDAVVQPQPKSVDPVESRPIEADTVRTKPSEQATNVHDQGTHVADAGPAAKDEGNATPAVDAPRNRTYVTVEGDTPASIAQAHYEDAKLAAALMAYNGVEIPAETALTAGGEVLIPQAELLRREFAGLIPAVAPPAVTPSVERPVLPSSNVAARDDRAHPQAPSRDVTAIPAQPSVPNDAREVDVSKRTYEVRRGETVYDIARRELGLVARWREILELNEEQLGGDIDAIEPGMKLVLPEEGRSNVARQRGELLWR
jgi:hypothetical protein